MSYPDNSSKSYALHQAARKYMPSGNTRHSVYFAPYPLYASHGEGCWVTDVEGERRLDLINNYTSMIHGHRFEPVVEAIQKQAETLIAVGMPTEAEIDLARVICDRIDSIEQIRFANSGTEGVMMALKAARGYTGRTKIAKMEGAYHGSFDPMEVSVSPTPENWGSPEAPTSHLEGHAIPQSVADDVIVLPVNNIEAARDVLNAHADTLACIIIDPIPSRIGHVELKSDFIDFLRSWTKQNSVLLVSDEVYCVRLHYHGAQHLYNIEPDLTALGKIIGGGVPIGAVGGKSEIMDVFSLDNGRPKVGHAGTFNANPLAMAAGRAAMEALTASAIEDLNSKGEQLREGLRKALADSGVKGVVKGRGSLLSVLPVTDDYDDYRSLYRQFSEASKIRDVHQSLLNKNILMSPHAAMNLSTAMDHDDIEFAIEKFKEAFMELANC